MSSEQDPSSGTLRASIASVEETYAVAYVEEDCGDLTRTDSITFSLTNWQGKDEPQCGQIVELENVTLYRLGWRAESARPISAKQ